MDPAHKVASRWLRAQEEEPHNPSEGVLDNWQLEALADKSAWKGYRYSAAQWTWKAENYEDADEPDDWGDQTKKGPVMTLDEVLEEVSKTSQRWDSWIDQDAFQSKVKKTKKDVTQIIINVERVDGKPLSREERKHIERKLRLK